MTDGTAINTDREVWSAGLDYRDERIVIAEGRGIGISVGGLMIVRPAAEWHRLAAQPAPAVVAGEPMEWQDLKAAALSVLLGASPLLNAVNSTVPTSRLTALGNALRSIGAQPPVQAAPESELHLIMDRNSWRSALMGLCQGHSETFSTPELAAENVRKRLSSMGAKPPAPVQAVPADLQAAAQRVLHEVSIQGEWDQFAKDLGMLARAVLVVEPGACAMCGALVQDQILQPLPLRPTGMGMGGEP